MRPFSLTTLTIGFWFLLSSFQSQFNSPQTKPYSFVVIGAFTFEKNAKVYADWARKNGFDPKYALNPKRNMYYVYSYRSIDKLDAVKEVYKVRDKVEDAWVYQGPLKNMSGVVMMSDLPWDPADQAAQEAALAEFRGESDTTVKSGDNVSGDPGNTDNSLTSQLNSTQAAGDPASGNTSGSSDQDASVEGTDDVSEDPVLIETNEGGDTDATGPEEPDIKEDYKVYINTTNSQKLNEVYGSVEVLDWVRNRTLDEIKSHQLEGINDPKNGSSSVDLAHRIFGFRPMTVRVNMSKPETDTTGNVSTIGDSIIVDMPLVSLQHGDLAVLWHVLFYKDAAIMRPESQAELNSLLDLLRQNPNFNAVLHGHTNGSRGGKIIHLNVQDMEFFSMNGEHRESNGSAKKLSEERAFTIQQWLLQQGIEESRITIKGWGGKRMIYEEDDPRAFLNVRVEVEVLEKGR